MNEGEKEMSNFSTRLKELRTAAEHKQSDLASVLGVSVQSLSSYEMGREPKYEVLCMIAKHYDVSTDYLLGISDFKNTAEQEQFKEANTELEKLLLKYSDDVNLSAFVGLLTETLNTLKDGGIFPGLQHLALFFQDYKDIHDSALKVSHDKSDSARVEYLSSVNTFVEDVRLTSQALIANALGKIEDKEERKKQFDMLIKSKTFPRVSSSGWGDYPWTDSTNA
jgi:transcriptional regulator with XRE-family HTH domain